VKCLPPENKPEPAEIKTCNHYLAAELQASPEVRVILALGLVAHKAVLMAMGLKQSALAFAHGARHALPGWSGPGRQLPLQPLQHPDSPSHQRRLSECLPPASAKSSTPPDVVAAFNSQGIPRDSLTEAPGVYRMLDAACVPCSMSARRRT
jgi:hypothetical protein